MFSLDITDRKGEVIGCSIEQVTVIIGIFRLIVSVIEEVIAFSDLRDHQIAMKEIIFIKDFMQIVRQRTLLPVFILFDLSSYGAVLTKQKALSFKGFKFIWR